MPNHTLTTYFPNPHEELTTLRAYELRRQSVQSTVDRISPDQAKALSNLARVAPWMAPGVSRSLAMEGLPPDDPMVRFAAQQAALMNSQQAAFQFGPMGRVINPSTLQRGSKANRLRNALDAAKAAGILNDAGEVVEPSRDSPAQRYIFNDVRNAFIESGRAFPYHNQAGKRTMLMPGYKGPSEAARAFRVYEGQREEQVHQQAALQQHGFMPVARLQLPANVRALLDDWQDDIVKDGYIQHPGGGPENEVARQRFDTVKRQFEAHRINLPWMTAEGRAVVTVNNPRDAFDVRGNPQHPGYDIYADEELLEEQGYEEAYVSGSGSYGAGEALRGSLRKWSGVQPGHASEAVQQAGIPIDPANPLAPLAPIARAGFVTLDAPVQELQGQFRNAYAAANNKDVDWLESQSDLGIAISQARAGEEADLGGGFFVDPESAVARERVRREAKRGQIAGQNVTLGRAVASQVVEPGSKPYRILSGLVDMVPQVLDPSALALGKAGKLREARTLFVASDEAVEAAGGLRGLRRTVHGPTADAWLMGTDGTRVVDAIAAEPSPAAIWRATGRKLSPSTAARLADTTDPTEVRNTLRPLLGTELRSTGDVWPTGLLDPVSRPSGRTRRMLAQVPGRRIDTMDLDDAMRQVEAWGVNAHLDDALLDTRLDTLARSRSRADIYRVVEDLMRDTDGVLARSGVTSDTVRSNLTRLFAEARSDAHRYFVDEVGADVDVWSKVLNDGEVVDGLDPHLGMELIGRYIPLPDYRAVRRLTSRMPNLMGKAMWDAEGELRRIPSLIEHIQQDVWKPAALLRLAYPVRVIGEEQLRMAAASSDSMFRHPLSYISWVIGRKGGTDLAGEPLEEAEEFTRAMTRGTGGWLDSTKPNQVRTGPNVLYKHPKRATLALVPDTMDDAARSTRVTVPVEGTTHGTEEYLGAWADELRLLHTDPIARKVATSGTLDEVMEWLRGAGRNFRNELAAVRPEMADDAVARRYLETVAERIRAKTGGNDDLLDMIRTGKVNGENILDVDGIKYAKGFLGEKGTLAGYLDNAPDYVKGQTIVSAPGRERRFVDWAFGWLMAKPTNYLSRSPEFRQAYAQRATELAGYADDSDAMLEGLRKMGVSNRGVRMAERKSRLPNDTRLSLDEIDTLAKSYALEDVKGLLYDMSERSQFLDAMRVVFPFGEAWKEVITRWGTLATKNPKTIRRFQQTIEGARGEDFGEVMGAPKDAEGKQLGFFHKNGFGDEVFVYPFSQMLTDKLIDVPIPLTGRVSGLNMMSSVMPGIGPAVQIPVTWFLQDKPEYRDLYDTIMPFGSPLDEGESVSGVLDALNWGPSWLRTGVQALQGGGFDENSDRTYNNSVMHVAQYLYSTGAYDTSTAAGQQELLEDARSKSRMFYAIRAMATFGAPSAPAPEWLVQTGGGDLVTFSMLRDEYFSLQQEDFDTADEVFLERYGDQVALVMTPFTESPARGQLPSSTAFGDWVAKHPDLRTSFPNTYHLFGPDGGEHSQAVYEAQLRAGERVALSPEEWLRASEDGLGRMQMRKARREVGANPTESDRQWLRDIEAWVREEYPGYEGPTRSAATVEAVITELESIAKNGAVGRTPVGKALNAYLEERSWAQSEAESRGYASFGSAQGTQDLRVYLRQFADSLAFETPGFSRVWHVLESEMTDDESEEVIPDAS